MNEEREKVNEMNKTEAKKLIKEYLKEAHNLKVVNINNKFNIWIAVDDGAIPYEICVDYKTNTFGLTMLSTVCFHRTSFYRYEANGIIKRI